MSILMSLVIAVAPVAMAQSVSDQSIDPVEIEATKQTEKLQKELGLTDEQVKIVYDINLRYANERKQSANRTDIMNLMKKKEQDINEVLDNNQRTLLQNVRSQTTSVEIDGKRSFLRTNEENRRNHTINNRSVRNTEQLRNRPVRPQVRTEQAETNNQTNRPVRQIFNTRQSNTRPSTTSTPSTRSAVRTPEAASPNQSESNTKQIDSVPTRR